MRSSTKIVHLKKVTLKRVLGVFDLFSVSYGDLGSSIFYALGVTAFYALGATPIALGAAGIVFVCTAFTYAEMTSMIHEPGGSASFSRYAFNDLISFIAGWGLLLDYIVTIAISAFAVAPYLRIFFPPLGERDARISSSVAVILLLMIINIIGVKQSTRLSIVLTMFTLLVEFVIIGIGFALLFHLPLLIDHLRIGVSHVDWSPSWTNFWLGVAMAMVAYTGLETVAQLAGESEKPVKTLPRAIVVTMCVLIFVYLSLASIAMTAIPPKELGTTYEANPIAGIVSALPFGRKTLSMTVAILAALILIAASNAGLMGASRLSYNMGEYYQLPRFFFRVIRRFRTPAKALVFFSLIAIALILASNGQLSFLADLYNFGAMIAFFSAHVSLLVLRVRRPFWQRPFRLRLGIRINQFTSLPITAMIGAFATFSVWWLIIITKPVGRYVGLAWMVIGTGMYLYYRRKKRIKPAGRVTIEEIKIPRYHLIKFHRILVPIRTALQTDTMQAAAEIAKSHHAKVTALHVLDVPYSLPLNATLFERVAHAELLLKRAEAIARDINVEIDLKMIRARSVPNCILQTAKKGKYDLIILSAMYIDEGKTKERFGPIVEKIVSQAPCRVWVCQ